MELEVKIKKKLSGFSLDVDFTAGKETVGLLGASGSGKSMTLRCIAGIDTPDEGRVVLNGRVLFDSEKGINLPSRKRRVGFLFQNYALFPHMTVEENILFGLSGLKKSERYDKLEKVLNMVRLNGLEKRYPGQLSGGQQQRVALARALAVEPEVLLLDEPFSALDEFLKGHLIKQLMDSLSDYNGITICVSHNMEEVYRICSDLVVLNEGKVVARGDKKSIFLNPPTLSAARLTGYKNISRARRISENEIEAIDWGCVLNTGEYSGEVTHVGIRAHYIRLADGNNDTNVYKCWLSFVSETQFRMTVYLSIGKPPERKTDYHIQWEVTKEKWQEISRLPAPWDISLGIDRLILINDPCEKPGCE